MRRRRFVLMAAVLGGVLVVASMAVAEGGKKNLKADELTGYQENPDISTVAGGTFEVSIDDAAQTFTYELSYSGLEGTVQLRVKQTPAAQIGLAEPREREPC